MISKISAIFFIIICILFLECVPEAPHSNPLDPYNQPPDGERIIFRGLVLQKNPPHAPIDSCLVMLNPGTRYAYSNQSGLFSFTGLERGTFTIFISRTGFTADSFQIQTDTLNATPVQFHLNGKPVVQKLRIFSEFIDQWWPDPYYTVNVHLTAFDPDGIADLAQVTLNIPELNILKKFQQTSVKDSLIVQLRESDFPENNIFHIVGKTMTVILTDKSSSETTAGPFYVHRIIDRSPVALDPTLQDTVDSSPVFKWQPFIASFVFTYEISLFIINAGIAVLFDSEQNIPPDKYQYAYPDSLPEGRYYWTVGVRDEMGNFSRSKEASFTVQSQATLTREGLDYLELKRQYE